MIEATPLTGLLQILAVVILSMVGLHIATSMAAVALVSAFLYYGNFTTLFGIAGSTAWVHVMSDSMAMMPIFILMGLLAEVSGMGSDAFDAIYRWVYKIRGSLALAATFASAFFGTVCGSSIATIATIGGISNPEMKKRGYSAGLRMGAIATAGQIGMLIPPSIPAIIYCILVEESVGKVFIGNIIPGILMTIFFAATIAIWVRINPSAAPLSNDSFTLKEKIIGLKELIPIALIFLMMVGGIYFGVFSPNEAAGIGTLGILIIALAGRRLNWKRTQDAFFGTMKITAMILFIIMAAFLFTHTTALTGIAKATYELIIQIGGPPIVGIWLIIAVFIVFGCFLDVFALQVLFIPLFYPVVLQLGFSSVWFGTMSVVLNEIALLTPPIAGSLYITQQLDPEVSMGTVIKGVLPFYFAALLLVAIMTFYPPTITWLPETMMK